MGHSVAGSWARAAGERRIARTQFFVFVGSWLWNQLASLVEGLLKTVALGYRDHTSAVIAYTRAARQGPALHARTTV